MPVKLLIQILNVKPYNISLKKTKNKIKENNEKKREKKGGLTEATEKIISLLVN